MCDDADIRAKRGEFIGSVNRLNAQFRVVPDQIRIRLLQRYCTAWYGCQTWLLNTTSVKGMNIEWKKAVRRTLNLPRTSRNMTEGLRVRVGSDYVTAVRHVKNLGVYLDRHLDMTTQVSRTISTCSLHMRNIAQIRRYLTRPTTERVVNALITSRLDYCNSLLFGTSASNINRLQRLQNSVARLVTRQARRDSAMPLLRELHWLPVHHRVTYKIAELTFKALHVDLSPTYLQQFVQVYTPARSLRSACSYTLVANRSRTVAGDCTFVHAAATVWNALPVSVTSKDSLLSFKAALKTHLCALAYT